MTVTSKSPSSKDPGQVLQAALNDVDNSLTVNGFLVGKVGNKVTMIISTTTVASDTETYTFLDGLTQLYRIRVIYTTGTRDVMLSAERIS